MLRSSTINAGYFCIKLLIGDSFGAYDMFKIGDVVTLKSGSINQTVTNARDRNGVPHVWTSWFNKDGREEHGCYPADAVMLAVAKKPPIVNRGSPGGLWAASRMRI